MAYSSLPAFIYGDGAGGKMSLSIKMGVMNILSDAGFTFKTATPFGSVNPQSGKVIYKVPEIVQVENYDANTNPPTANTANWGWQTPQASDVEVTLDKRKIIRVKLEDFDDARLSGAWSGVVSYIISSIGMIILNDLNGYFYSRLAQDFDPTTGALRPIPTEAIVLPELVKDGITIDEARTVIYKLQRQFVKVNKTFNKNALGVKKSDLMMILDPYADINIRQAFTNQPNSLSERWVAKDLVGYQLGGEVTYFLDKMIGTNIALGTSFNKDVTIDISKFCGFIIHNQAIAFPFNFQKMQWLPDPEDANPRLIVKYQYGWGYLRPWLIFPIYKTAPTAKKP